MNFSIGNKVRCVGGWIDLLNSPVKKIIKSNGVIIGFEYGGVRIKFLKGHIYNIPKESVRLQKNQQLLFEFME